MIKNNEFLCRQWIADIGTQQYIKSISTILLYWILYCTLGTKKLMNHSIWMSNSRKELCVITTAAGSAFLEKRGKYSGRKSKTALYFPNIFLR